MTTRRRRESGRHVFERRFDARKGFSGGGEAAAGRSAGQLILAQILKP